MKKLKNKSTSAPPQQSAASFSQNIFFFKKQHRHRERCSWRRGPSLCSCFQWSLAVGSGGVGRSGLPYSPGVTRFAIPRLIGGLLISCVYSMNQGAAGDLTHTTKFSSLAEPQIVYSSVEWHSFETIPRPKKHRSCEILRTPKTRSLGHGRRTRTAVKCPFSKKETHISDTHFVDRCKVARFASRHRLS